MRRKIAGGSFAPPPIQGVDRMEIIIKMEKQTSKTLNVHEPMKLTRKSTMWKKQMLPFVAALVLSGVRTANAADYPSTILADHPIAYYRLEETSGTTAADSSASGLFPGTYIVNGSYPLLGQPGIDTNSITLSVADPSSVTAGYYPEFNQQAPFSFEIWARPVSTDPGNNRCPIGNWSGWGLGSGWDVY